MSGDRRPIARLEFRADGKTFSVLSIWRGKFPGGYDISREKPTERRAAMSFGDALRAWSAGNGYLTFWVESERERRGAPAQPSGASDGFGDAGSFDAGDDLPF